MKFKPILFSTPMVEAILEGRKVMTRRIVKPQPDDNGAYIVPRILGQEQIWDHWCWDTGEGERIIKPCPYEIGMVLWVRETWQETTFLHPSDENYGYIYKASKNGQVWAESDGEWKWKPSIFMPKEACRIWLEIKSIGVERLQDISEEDAIAEGVRYAVNKSTGHVLFQVGEENSALHFMPEGFHLNHRIPPSIPLVEKDLIFAHWAELWCRINGRESWDSNPWVWKISFTKIDKPFIWK